MSRGTPVGRAVLTGGPGAEPVCGPYLGPLLLEEPLGESLSAGRQRGTIGVARARSLGSDAAAQRSRKCPSALNRNVPFQPSRGLRLVRDVPFQAQRGL